MRDPTPPHMWRPAFLSVLSRMGVISGAARAVGISPSAVHMARRKDAEFDLQCHDAMQMAIEHLEQVAWDRATKHSDQLLIFLLKAHKPEVYNQAVKTEHSGPGGGPIPVKAYIGFDPSKWNASTKAGDEVETVDGDYVIIPEERKQVASGD